MSEFQALPRESLHEQWATIGLTTLVLLPLYVGAAYALRLVLFESENLFFPALLWGSLLTAVSLAYSSYFTILRHRRTKWKLDKHSFCFHIGLWYRHEYYIARERVQYVDVRQGPLERRFGTSQLVIYTAGTMNVVILKGLLYEDAQAVRRELINDDQTVNTP